MHITTQQYNRLRNCLNAKVVKHINFYLEIAQKTKVVPILVTFCNFVSDMRIIATKTLKQFWEDYPVAKQSLLAWYEESEKAEWKSPQELKQQFGNASIITNKRVVFNIHGNSYRLIVDIEYRLKIIFVVWFGTHSDYDKIDTKAISYDKTHQK